MLDTGVQTPRGVARTCARTYSWPSDIAPARPCWSVQWGSLFELEPLQFADVALVSAGAQSTYASTIAKPSGLSASTPYYFTFPIVWFTGGASAPSPPTGGGTWTLLNWVSDNRSADKTTQGLWGKAVSDASSEPSTYSFTPPSGGTDWLGQVTAWSNVDPSSPVAGTSVTSDPLTSTITLPSVTVGIAGSCSVLGAGSWNYNTWTSNIPTSYTQSLGSTNEELGTYYRTGLAAGSSAPSFPTAKDRYAVVQAVLQPVSGAATTSDPGESAARRQLRANAIYRMSPRSEREAQTFLRAQRRAYSFAPLAV